MSDTPRVPPASMLALGRLDRPGPPIRSVGYLLIPGFALLSYAAAIEPLRAANTLSGKPLYEWWHATPDGKPARASNGVAVVPNMRLDGALRPLDLLLVCAGGNPAAFDDARTFKWLQRFARAGTILGGVSGGPLVLAKAGLLSGRRCTVHWEHVPTMVESFPDIRLTRSLFALDRDRLTCSGGVAGLDMMSALITRDHGYELGAAVSDWFLHTHLRDGMGPQRMDPRQRFGIADEKVVAALHLMEASIEAPLERAQLAERTGLSLRQLERAFRNQLGYGIHEHYLGLRLRRSRQLLRETSLSVLDVGVATGFASASHFTRAFRQAYGMSPREVRRPLRPSKTRRPRKGTELRSRTRK